MEARIAALPGDGIGPAVATEGVKIPGAVAEALGHPFTFKEALIGGCAIEATGDPLPEATLAACRRSGERSCGTDRAPGQSVVNIFRFAHYVSCME